MRIRLIQPPLVQPRYRQLTLPVVGAELAAQGLDVEACDENVEPVDLSDVDLVGISCHVYNAPRAIELASIFRRRGIPVVMGGTFATTAPHLLAPHCDSVVVGELEGQSAQIAADARSGRLKPVYRAAAPPSLAHTVKPDFSLLKNDRYWRYNFPVELSRGCRFACRFCTSHQLFPEPRTRSLDDIARDLAQHDRGLVEVVDVNFLNDPGFFRRAAPLLAEARGPGWTGQTTVADLAADPALPELLASSRCRAVFVGLETISRDGLRSIDKSWSKPEVFLEVARRLREMGVLVQVGVIVGLDTDTPASFVETARWLEAARAQTVSFTYLHYYPATAPFEEMARQGRLISTDWRDYDGNHLVIRPPSVPAEELRLALRQFLRRLYSFRSIGRRAWHRGMLRRPGQLLHHLLANLAMRTYYRRLLPFV
jgi:radical SAM superfamily enzyme YgiQ (UPF0313 family)